MKTIFPNKIKKGDKIAVIAPACSAKSMKPDTKKRAEKNTKTILGLQVFYSKNAFEKDIMDSSSIQSKVSDLHNAFRDRNIKGVSCVRGGYNSNAILPYIDWGLIKSNPKPLWGYSDITVLSNAIYAKTGVVTYSGPNFSSFGIKDEKISEYIFAMFRKCIMDNKPFELAPSKYFGERKVKTQKNKGVLVLQKGKCEGVLIGGNLCSLNLLQGTEYMPSLKDKVLFIEEDDFGGKNTPLEFERNLESLLQLPYASTIKGLVFGRFQKGANMNLEKLKYILKSKKIAKSIPIIVNADFGHTHPMFTFPIGGTVKIETVGSKVRIEILKH